VSSNVVVLVLGTLMLAFAVYFTHTVLSRSGGTLEAGIDGRGFRFRLTAHQRNLAVTEARAAGVAKKFPTDEGERAATALDDVDELRVAHCLWVDDDPTNNVHERRMLERLHVRIDLARSSEEALRDLVGRRYDFIITDFTRPGPDGDLDQRAGVEFLRLLAEAPDVPPIIVYAGIADDRAIEARRCGARAVETVPSELLRRVVETLKS
jgi:CheY-like chemotaxis protein